MMKSIRVASVIALSLGMLVPEMTSASAQGYKKRSAGKVYVAPAGGPRGGYVVRRRRGPSGGAIAAGAAAAIIGGIIVNEAIRSERRSGPVRYYDEGPGLSCYQLERRCDAGYDWACRRLDNDPGC